MRRIVNITAIVAALVIAANICTASTLNISTFQQQDPPENSIWLDTLDNLQRIKQGYRKAERRRSVDCNPITIAGKTFERGVGTHADSHIIIQLDGNAVRFVSAVGVDDEGNGQGSVVFQVLVDGAEVANTGLMVGGDEPKIIDIDLTDAKKLELIVDHGPDGEMGKHYDHADWAGAFIQMKSPTGFSPRIILEVPVEAPIPIASGDRAKPEIHGPRIVGTTTGRPFLFKIPATGEGKLTYSAANLPAGLTLDTDTGIITGRVEKNGRTRVTITVKGKKGYDRRNLIIEAGERKLALTPPMGWNSWNIFGLAVTAEDIKRTADLMVETGLADYGFTYINIDDGWEADRDENGFIRANQKFPDMKELADYVHSKGLKLGIYSSPGPFTCGRYIGSYQYEQQDVITWSEWGIDYLKYDWCLYEDIAKDHSIAELQKPYKLMRQLLDEADRDIVYSLCQYGMGNVWQWAGQPHIGGNLWRTTGDIVDTWQSMSSIGFDHNGPAKWAGPGHWNDPDMMVVGWLGWGDCPYPTRLLPNEQITHVTLWAMQAAPLLLGCDLSQMDQFTLDLLKNHDVIEVNQDPLGRQARRMNKDGDIEVWTRPLWDGTKAVAVFNRGLTRQKVTLTGEMLHLKSQQPVYDIWQRKMIGKLKDKFEVEVPIHGAQFLKIGTPKNSEL